MINNYQKCQIRKRLTIGLRSHSHAALMSLISVFHTPCPRLAWVDIPWSRNDRLILMLKRAFELFSNIFNSFCHTVLLINNNSMLFLGKFLFFILCSPPVFFSIATGFHRSPAIISVPEPTPPSPRKGRGGHPKGCGGRSMPLYPKRCYNFGSFAGDPLKNCFTHLFLS